MQQPPESILTFVSLMKAHAAVLDAVEDEVQARVGIPLAWHELLHHLSMAPEGQARMQDLARSLLLSRSGLTRLADRLEREGLIERTACPTDRRGTFARITDAGRDQIERSRPVVLKAVDEHVLAHLGRDERATLRAALDKLVAANPSERVACDAPVVHERTA